MVDIGPFGITSVMGLYGVYGLKNVLEILDPKYVTLLLKVIKPYTLEKTESMGDIKYEINQAIGGGYLFRSGVFEVPEAATVPLKIFSIFTA